MRSEKEIRLRLKHYEQFYAEFPNNPIIEALIKLLKWILEVEND